jgi:hypothetical protein
MLDQVAAIRFDAKMGTGRTRPCLATCAKANGEEIDIIVKFSAGCERGCTAMVAEAAAALLASDLDLPVPEAFLVEVTTEFAATIPDLEAADLARRSVGFNFGSKKLPPGFATWPVGRIVPQCLLQSAAEILAFDLLIGNPDRRPEKPNCLFDGRSFAKVQLQDPRNRIL